ncbi:hypothetical protein LTR33_019089, partial [Friedmanniomyces endolithicus]
IVDRANRTGPTPLLQSRTSPANGGAYPRLDTTGYVGPADSTTAGYAGRPDSASASNGGEGRQDTARYVPSPISATASNRDQGRQAPAAAASPLSSDGSSSVCDVYVHKKRSTFRNKDHFGPSATASARNWEWAGSGSQLLCAAVLAVLLGLAFFSLTSGSAHNIHATALLVLSPMAVPCDDGREEDEEATASGKAFSWHDAMWPGTSGVG